MPPQTKPVNTRFADLQKAAKKFMVDTEKSGRSNAKQQAAAAKGATKSNRENLSSLKAATAELQKHNKLLKENAALARKGGMGGVGGPGQRGGPSGGGGRQTLGGAMGIRKWMGPAALASMVGSVVGLVASQARESIDTYAKTVKAQRNVAGMLSRNLLSDLVGEAAGRAFTPEEVLQNISGIGRAVGVNRPGQFPKGAMEAVQQAQLGMGMDPSETIGLMTGVRQAGVRGFDTGEAGLRKVRRIWADGVASGLEKTRVPEHMANVSKGMQMVGEQVAGVVDVAGLSEAMASIGQLGAGFQGRRGAGVMGAMQQVFTQASRLQAPDAVQAFMLRHVGGFGGPGGSKNLFEAQLQLEKGFNKENVQNVVRGAIRETGGGQGAAFLMQQAFPGLSLGKAMKMVQQGEGGFKNTPEFNRLMKEAKPETIAIDKQMLEESKTQSKLAALRWDDGKMLFDEVQRIQTSITEFVSRSMPAVEAVLDKIAGFLEEWVEGMDFILKKFGKDPKEIEETKKRIEGLKELATTEGGLEKLKSDQKTKEKTAAASRGLAFSMGGSGGMPGMPNFGQLFTLKQAEQEQAAADEMKKVADREDRRKRDEVREVQAQEAKKKEEVKKKESERDEVTKKMGDDTAASRVANEATARNSKDEPDRKAMAAAAATQAGSPSPSDVILDQL